MDSIVDVLIKVFPGLDGMWDTAEVLLQAIPFLGDLGFIFVAGTGFLTLIGLGGLVE